MRSIENRIKQLENQIVMPLWNNLELWLWIFDSLQEAANHSKKRKGGEIINLIDKERLAEAKRLWEHYRKTKNIDAPPPIDAMLSFSDRGTILYITSEKIIKPANSGL